MNVSLASTFNGVVTYNNVNGNQNYNGNVTFNNGSGINFTAARTINTGAAAAVTTNGTVTISGTAIGTFNLNNTLTINGASTLNIASINLTVSAATAVNGTIKYNDAISSYSFSDVTIGATGTWDCSGYNVAFQMNGNLTNGGTFNASATTIGPSLYQFTTAGSTINGTLTIPYIQVVSPGTLTNTGALTITDSLYGTGQYIQGTGSTLYYNTGNIIVVSTFNPSAANNLVDYDYAGAQKIKAGNAAFNEYYNVNCSNSGTKTLGNNLIVQNNLLIQNTAALDVNNATNRNITIGGNWTVTSTNASPFVPENGTVTFNGSAGVQAISSVTAGGLSLYSVVFNNTSASNPNITTSCNIVVNHTTLFTLGNLDLQGNTYSIIGDTNANTTDRFNGGLILTSVAGANFTCNDLKKRKILYFSGTQIGTAANGVTINVTSGQIQFTNFTEYGTASFTKTKNNDDVFGGGNYYHGPVTFTAAVTASRWRMGDNSSNAHAVADTFCNATFNAFADSGANNNFIVCANSINNAFYGTTHMTSNTPGGFYVCRLNDSGSASCEFHGPVIASVDLTGSITFANSGPNGHDNLAVFDSTITLNSTGASTGFYNFANAGHGSVILNPTAQFLTGSINGKTNVYLNYVTQYGTLLQTINTSGSSGSLYVGGVTAMPSYKCTFNGPCHFTADTAGYFVGCTFNDTTNININHPNANGYLISDTFRVAANAIVGDLRIQNDYFGGTVTLQHTASFNSTSNGGNTFNGNAIVQNSGTGTLRMGDYGGNGDTYYGTITFIQNGGGTSTIQPAYGLPSYFNGNISVAGSTGNPIVFASTGGTMVVQSSAGIQTFSNGAAPIPTIVNLTMNTLAANSVLQFNFPTSVTGTLNLTQGLINLNGNTLTLGTGTGAATGTLSYTGGWLYGGTFTRWVSATAIAIPATTGLFPMGSNAAENAYHPLWFGSATNLTTGGTVSVTHTNALPGTNPVPAFLDASWGVQVQAVSLSTWQVSTGNGLAVSAANNAQLRYGGTGFTPFTLIDLDATQAAAATGTYSAPTSITVPLEVNRTALSTAKLNNTWYIGTRNWLESPLPITLLDFDADATNQQSVNVTWSTTSQVNNKLFTVEKTQDGINFDTVTAVPGAGNSNELLNYSVLDEKPFQGTSYYRLKQTDFNGNSTFSSLVPVNIASKSDLTVLSNPVNTTLTFNYSSPIAGIAEVKIISALGETISANTVEMQQGPNTYSFNIDRIAKGSYYLQLNYGNTLINNKFIKQ
jgi:hypothetical protein